ncbi:MAG: putative transposase [Polaribacter sp.]
MKIELRYDLQFFEIGTKGNHVHFLIQSVPMNSPKKIISTVKSITAKEIFRIHPEVKRFLWGGNFWTTGYYVSTVGQYANEEVIKKYLQNQGKSDYEKLHSDKRPIFYRRYIPTNLFDSTYQIIARCDRGLFFHFRVNSSTN